MGGFATCTEEFQAMTRRKVTLSFIANDSTRKATFKKRKKGLIKKLNELSTLCGIEACAVIYSPFETPPEAWPSPDEVHRVLDKFRALPEMDQTRRMVNMDSFIRQRIEKINEQVGKVKKENREKEMIRLMHDSLTGSPLHSLSILDLKDLGWVVDQRLTDVCRRKDFLIRTMAEDQNQVLPPPPPPPFMVSGEVVTQGYGGQNMDTMEAMQGSQPWNPETMNSIQDDDQPMDFDVDDILLPFEDANNSSGWAPLSP